MDAHRALRAFDEQLRRAGDGSSGPVRRRVGAEPGDWCGIEWSDLSERNADRVIAEQVRYFAALDRPFEWKYYGYDQPADLPRRLRDAGLRPEPAEALMVAEITELAAEPVPPAGVGLVAVTDRAGVDLMVRVHEEVFGDDHSEVGQAVWRELRTDPDSVTPVLAMAGDRPVSAARVEFHRGTEFASLWGGGTLPQWRGQGVYRALVAYRARLAAERGYRYLRVDALAPSRPILERLGFVQLTTTVPFTTPA